MMTGNWRRLKCNKSKISSDASACAVRDVNEIVMDPCLIIKVIYIPQNNAALLLPSSLSCNLFKYGSFYAYSVAALSPAITSKCEAKSRDLTSPLPSQSTTVFFQALCNLELLVAGYCAQMTQQRKADSSWNIPCCKPDWSIYVSIVSQYDKILPCWKQKILWHQDLGWQA